ncbi:transient receptor potential cation channel trpm [Trichonephila clavipes]|nr:transient receptor potential cation channel trpm [Trichonephila clavipes]
MELEAILTEIDYGELWILSDSRGCLQHLNNWKLVVNKYQYTVFFKLYLQKSLCPFSRDLVTCEHIRQRSNSYVTIRSGSICNSSTRINKIENGKIFPFDISLESDKDRMKNKRKNLTLGKKIYEFYGAPITKFWGHTTYARTNVCKYHKEYSILSVIYVPTRVPSDLSVVIVATSVITSSGTGLPPLPRTATADSEVVQSGRPIFDDFFQHLWPYIGNNTANVVFQMVKRLWLIRIDQ